MPPFVALFYTTAFVVFLLWRDLRQHPRLSRALWIPQLWMLIIGSRFVSQWFDNGWQLGGPDLVDGSPIDRAVFLSLQVAGLVVLLRRGLSWPRVASSNPWLTMFLAYACLSILWSDFPLVALKRWAKVLGHPIMVLVILTDPEPREAIVRLMRRSAYILLPFSILLIKYYPGMGRDFEPWTGEAFNTGVTTNKNELGYVCLTLGFFLVWHFLTTWRRPKGRARRNELILTAALLLITGWLLNMANSATSLMSLIVGSTVVLFFGIRSINRSYAAVYLLAGLVAFGFAEFEFSLTDEVIRALGRNTTLTGRTELWHDVLQFDVNPLIGAGFESFWLGERVERLWAMHWWRPTQAHNGYLETYLNLGWIGVALLMGWICSSLWKASAALPSDFDLARLRLGIIAIVTVYNYTESTFTAMHLLWFVFYIGSLNYSRLTSELSSQTPAIRATRASGGRTRVTVAPPSEH